MKNKHSVLLTGASGFLGSRVLSLLIRTGYHVTILGRRRPPIPEASAADFVQLDFLEAGLSEFLQTYPGADAIVHLAATPKLGPRDGDLMWRLHVETAGLLAGAANRWGARFLHVSTAFVGAGESGHLLEGPAVEGRSANEYERSKTAAEAAVLKACPWGAEILRPGIILAGADDGAEDHLISPLGMFLRVTQTRLGTPLPFRPPPETTLGLCRRDDVVQFISNRLAASPHRSVSYWNMVAPHPLKIWEAAQALGLTFGGQKRWGSLEPWRPYLEARRTWDVSGYVRESLRIGKPVLPITGDELGTAAGKVLEVPSTMEGALSDACIA